MKVITTTILALLLASCAHVSPVQAPEPQVEKAVIQTAVPAPPGQDPDRRYSYAAPPEEV